jgi:sensor histidine kinase YesM
MKKSFAVFDSFGAGVFFFIVAFGLAYFSSTYITKLENISDRINETSLSQKTKKIVLEASRKNLLIKSYNRMVEELEISAIKLAQSERKRLGANGKQVAHEIKKTC